MFFLEQIIVLNEITLNYFAILIASLSYLILGILWYSPLLFGNKKIKFDDEERYHQCAFSLVGAYLGELILSFTVANGLAFFIALSQVEVYGAVLISLVIWTCFVGTTYLSSALWSHRDLKHLAIHLGFTLTGFTLMGFILGSL